MKTNLNIGVIGTGYVGLVAGSCFSDKGNTVTCFDIDKNRVKDLSAGEVPFYEPGLEEKVKLNRKKNRLNFSLMNEETLNRVDLIFICVGTPDDGTGKTNLGQINDAVSFIIEKLREKKIIIIRSTVPVGTCKAISERIDKESSIDHIV